MVKKRILSITFLTSVLALNFINPCLAMFERAILSKIAITPQNNGTYKILVKTDRDVPINKIVKSKNKIVLDLKNTKASKFVNTIYNNSLGVDHVIVQPISDNRVKVFIEGENISYSNIVLDSRRGFSVFEGLSKEVDYSNPVYYNDQPTLANNKGKPNYNLGSPGDIEPVQYIDEPPPIKQDIFNQASKNVQPKKVTKNKPEPVKAKEFKKQVNKNTPEVNNVVNTTRAKNNNNYKNTAYTDKQTNNYNQEAYQGGNYYNNKNNYQSQRRSAGALSGSMHSKVSVLSDETILSKLFSLDIFDWGLRFLVLAFIIVASYKLFFRKQPKYTIDLTDDDMRERELALLKSMNDKYAATSNSNSGYERKPSKKDGYSSFTQYGLNEYQNSQLPPSNKPRKGQKPIGVRKQKQVQTPRPAARKKVQPPPENTPSKPKMTSRESESEKISIDNKRFLEKMAKIYEKSGRSDLAEGIQNNIKKRTIM